MINRNSDKTDFSLRFAALSENEGFARVCAAAFASRLELTLEQLSDIRTAVSEAVTNAVVHAYPEGGGDVLLTGAIACGELTITVADEGRGIADVAAAREPFFTTGGEERSGMGFTVMESLMDEVTVRSEPGEGTTVTLVKRTA